MKPEPSEPVFGADLPPQLSTNLLQLNILLSKVIKENILFDFFTYLILLFRYIGIFLSSNANLRISSTEEACKT